MFQVFSNGRDKQTASVFCGLVTTKAKPEICYAGDK